MIEKMSMRTFGFAFLIGIELSLSHLSWWFGTFTVVLRDSVEIGKGLNVKTITLSDFPRERED